MIADCGRQLRVGGIGAPFALDYGAVMLVGQARGVDVRLLSELLPVAEAAILTAGDDAGPEDEEADT